MVLASRYSILLYSILWYSILWYSIVLHSILWYSIFLYSIYKYSIFLYDILFSYLILFSIVLHSVFLHLPIYTPTLSLKTIHNYHTPQLIIPTSRNLNIFIPIQIHITQHTILQFLTNRLRLQQGQSHRQHRLPRCLRHPHSFQTQPTLLRHLSLPHFSHT